MIEEGLVATFTVPLSSDRISHNYRPYLAEGYLLKNVLLSARYRSDTHSQRIQTIEVFIKVKARQQRQCDNNADYRKRMRQKRQLCRQKRSSSPHSLVPDTHRSIQYPTISIATTSISPREDMRR